MEGVEDSQHAPRNPPPQTLEQKLAARELVVQQLQLKNQELETEISELRMEQEEVAPPKEEEPLPA